MSSRTPSIRAYLASLVIPLLWASSSLQAAPQQDFAAVSKGFQKVQSAPGEGSLFGLWLDSKKNQLLAEFPRGWEKKKFLMLQQNNRLQKK